MKMILVSDMRLSVWGAPEPSSQRIACAPQERIARLGPARFTMSERRGRAWASLLVQYGDS